MRQPVYNLYFRVNQQFASTLTVWPFQWYYFSGDQIYF